MFQEQDSVTYDTAQDSDIRCYELAVKQPEADGEKTFLFVMANTYSSHSDPERTHGSSTKSKCSTLLYVCQF